MFLRKCILVALLPVATVFSAEAGDKRKGFSFRQDSVSIEAGAASDNSYGGFRKFRFGGYGEMLANFMDYGIIAIREHRMEIPVRIGRKYRFPVLSLHSITNLLPNGFSAPKSSLKRAVSGQL